MRAPRVLALALLVPFAGCVLAIDRGGRKGLEKRIGSLEGRVKALEQERGIAPPEAGGPSR